MTHHNHANDDITATLRLQEGPEAIEPGDMLNREGAMMLAKRLQAYWHAQGYPAALFWAEPIEERFAKIGTYEIYRVACNLVNGLPPRYMHERTDGVKPPAGLLSGPARRP
jgi:hypothetical protein